MEWILALGGIASAFIMGWPQSAIKALKNNEDYAIWMAEKWHKISRIFGKENADKVLDLERIKLDRAISKCEKSINGYKAVEKEYNTILERNPNSSEASDRLGDIIDKRKEAEKALVDLKEKKKIITLYIMELESDKNMKNTKVGDKEDFKYLRHKADVSNTRK
jgi:hypothetical protein